MNQQNIFVSSLASSPSSSPVLGMADFHSCSSPRSDRVVGVCRNCSHHYRIGSRCIEDFCSKDCHTTYNLFGSYMAHKTPEKSAAEIRTSIYQFQQRLDGEELACDSTGESVVSKDYSYDTPQKDIKVKKTPSKRTNFFDSLFTNPQPARPQLHTFF